jgi:hypothetical protein
VSTSSNGNGNSSNQQQLQNYSGNYGNYREMEYGGHPPPPMGYDYHRSYPPPMDPRMVVDPRSGYGGGYGGGGYGYGGGGYGYPSQYSSPYTAAPHDRDYQPKANYYSDYRPSQSYPAGFSSNMDYYNQPVTNPYYMKSLHYH